MKKRELTHHLISKATARLTSARREAEEAAGFDLSRRQAASTILNPNEVSGEYDAGRTLSTTLRGALRPITLNDIRAFQRNVHNLKKKRAFKGGVTAQAVIDHALPADATRANKEIRMSVPASYRGDKFHFITNAGPDSDASRHHVHVQFMEFENQVGASSLDPKKIGKAVANGALRFDCDCGRHTFWFRYMATIGEYNYGRAETGFPKIRNPKLVGIACKHVLRTMHNILRDQSIQLKIADQVLKARAVLDRRQLKTERVKAADVREHAKTQAGKRTSSTNLKTSAKKADEAAKRKARSDMANKAAGKMPKEMTPMQKAQMRNKAIAGLQAALDLGAMTQAQFDAIVANMGK
ncbi:hypothetical protein PQR05_29345 [Paraburkholderia sediminicola]|uniref:hypothetical protein n=1 Tax=Paraburkholderia sediminicola TaxID=458836 RepID=UPI0038BD25D8